MSIGSVVNNVVLIRFQGDWSFFLANIFKLVNYIQFSFNLQTSYLTSSLIYANNSGVTFISVFVTLFRNN